MSVNLPNWWTLLFSFTLLTGALAGTRIVSAKVEDPPVTGTSETTFSPSNVRTADGEIIPADQFIPAARCLGCHADTHAAWSQSLHRNAAREPFYKESVDILKREQGSGPAQHCESCHSPVAVLSGDLLKGTDTSRAFEDEGVTCIVCHSISQARLDGTGSYTMGRPALLVRANGSPVIGAVSDAEIMANIPAHRRAIMRPPLKQPEFCAVCHKSVATVALNKYKFLRGFSTYDEWQQSGASGEAITPFYRREQRLTCNACHMPRVASKDDVAAKDGLLISHRWLGANTAAPLFYQQTKQVELTEKFLRANVLSVDIFALRSEGTGKYYAPLKQHEENRIELQPGSEVTAEVVIANRLAAHSFPPELRDMYEPWVEFEVLDAGGKTIFHSGFIKPDQSLDETAHVYKSILLDEAGRPITRHQMWLARVKAYDNAVPSGRSDIACYRFRIPRDAQNGTAVTLRARVNYRRFIQDYTDYVLQRQQASQLRLPVVEMAAAETKVSSLPEPGRKVRNAAQPDLKAESRRWNDYAIGLLEQAQYGAAADAFRRASALNPTDADLLVSAAIAEMKTERFGPEHEQLNKAAALLQSALKLDPALPRARFYHALLLRSQGKAAEAAIELGQLSREHPRDREVQRQFGQTLYTLGRTTEARAAFEAILVIDPNDAGAYQFLAPVYSSEGRVADADRARSLYLLWRDDPRADVISARFFAAHPEWNEERVLFHAHGEGSPLRPSLTGALAAPAR